MSVNEARLLPFAGSIFSLVARFLFLQSSWAGVGVAQLAETWGPHGEVSRPPRAQPYPPPSLAPGTSRGWRRSVLASAASYARKMEREVRLFDSAEISRALTRLTLQRTGLGLADHELGVRASSTATGQLMYVIVPLKAGIERYVAQTLVESTGHRESRAEAWVLWDQEVAQLLRDAAGVEAPE